MTLLSHHLRKWLDLALTLIAAAKADPSAEDLSAAPVLDLWRPQIIFFSELVLEGL